MGEPDVTPVQTSRRGAGQGSTPCAHPPRGLMSRGQRASLSEFWLHHSSVTCWGSSLRRPSPWELNTKCRWHVRLGWGRGAGLRVHKHQSPQTQASGLQKHPGAARATTQGPLEEGFRALIPPQALTEGRAHRDSQEGCPPPSSDSHWTTRLSHHFLLLLWSPVGGVSLTDSHPLEGRVHA